METLRHNNKLIRSNISVMNKNDDTWKWSCKFANDNKVLISWGYLDYCYEGGTFSLVLEKSQTCDDNESMMYVRNPDGSNITCEIVAEEPTKVWQKSYEEAINHLLYALEGYAHSRY